MVFLELSFIHILAILGVVKVGGGGGASRSCRRHVLSLEQPLNISRKLCGSVLLGILYEQRAGKNTDSRLGGSNPTEAIQDIM